MNAKSILKLHPEILSKNGRKPDADDLLELRKAKRAEANKKSIPLATVKRELGLM